MDCRKYINTVIDKNKRVLEIGPLNRTIISKQDYPNVYYADIRNTEEIKRLYTNNQYLEETNIKVDIDSIVDIDFVIKDSYEKTFKGIEKFDYVVASHVLEHIPDIIYFFQDIKSILKPDGKLIIIYPDKRYCFDHFRVEASFRDAYEIFINEDKSNPKMVFDFIFNVVKENNPSYFWEADNLQEKENNERFEKTKMAYNKTVNNESNDDIHYWPFSDYGFLKFLEDLSVSDLLDFELLEFYETEKNTQEFLLILKHNNTPNKALLYNKLKIMNPNYIFSQLSNEIELIEAKHNNEIIEKNKNHHRELNEKAEVYNKTLIEKDDKILTLENKINDIYNSTSWKITKPLRNIKKIVSVIKNKNH